MRNDDRPVIATAGMDSPCGRLHLYGTARGLLAVVLPGGAPEAAESWVGRTLRAAAFRPDATMLASAIEQLSAYFAGTRRSFDLPLDPRGTPFQRLVWDAVLAVPYGETRTYSQIARAIGRPNAVRAVGAANGANPLAPIIPCHRLVGADGGLRGYGGGLAMKRWLLELEQSWPL